MSKCQRKSFSLQAKNKSAKQSEATTMMMIRCSILLLLPFLSPSLAFTSVGKALHVHSPSCLYQKKASWPEYKHDYIEPLTPHQVESKIHNHVDPNKRAVSNEYWLRQLEDEKAKMHSMSSKDETASSNSSTKQPSETFEHYKHANIDPITPHETPSKVTSHMDPIRRQNADKFWRAKYIDEKEKLRNKQKRP